MTVVLFRVDGGELIGLGHIIRCLTLANSLRKKKIRSIFVIKKISNKAIKKIEEENYEIRIMPTHLDMFKDAVFTNRIIKEFKADIIITDISNTKVLASLDSYEKYLLKLKQRSSFLITIDDLNLIRFSSDIVINPNYDAEKLIKKSSENTNTIFLYGAKYFIFREEFIQAIKKRRIIKKRAKNILITMGGNDLCNLTTKIINSISELDLSHLELKIVLGSAYSEEKRKKLLSTVKILNTNYKILTDVNNMADLMLWADLAFTACGLTRYETAVTGTPSITLSQHIYEHQVMQNFKKVGTTDYLGFGKEILNEKILSTFIDLLENKKRREIMCRAGKSLLDGKGLNRIIKEINTLILGDKIGSSR
jgi:UDP-2,4-diacetamido-2,4,6-trideoxy-beta-L-altropyranose hydrolase